MTTITNNKLTDERISDFIGGLTPYAKLYPGNDNGNQFPPSEILAAFAELQERRRADNAEPVSFDDLRDAVAEMTGGSAMQWDDIHKGHQPVPFINFNSLARIVDKFRVAPPAPVVAQEVSLCLAFFASVIKSGEPWTTTCQQHYDAARAAMLHGKADQAPVKQPSSNGVIGWLRSDYNSDDKRDPNAPLFMLGSNDPSETWGVKYIPLTGNSPVIADCWVACSERMPEEIGRYWCYVEEQNSLGKSHYQWNCSWNGDRWWVECENGGRVTHWMPLPAAPQQEVK